MWYRKLALNYTNNTQTLLCEDPHPRQAGTHVIALRLKEVKLQRNSVLGGGHQLPDAVFVWGVFLGPARAGDGAIELGEESTTGS